MAIVINGSGSITGISAGGLPDGSVTAADLASGAITSGALPSGSVLQVVQAQSSVNTSTSSTTYTDTGFSASITPSSTSSKVLVFALVHGYNGGNDYRLATSIYRDSTNLGGSDYSGFGYLHAVSQQVLAQVPMQVLDSPNTTSNVEYSVYFRTGYSGQAAHIRNDVVKGVIILMEIAG